jgi:hypothetical protein
LGASLLAWWDARDATTITETSGAVSQWDDNSSNEYHLVQGTGSAQPIYSATSFFGSTPGITFDGSDDVMVVPDVDIGTIDAFAAFFSVTPIATGDDFARLVTYRADEDANDAGEASSAVFAYVENNTGPVISGFRAAAGLSDATLANGTTYRIGSVFDGSNHTLYVDNSAQEDVASTGDLATPGSVSVGGNVDGGENGNLRFQAIVLMNRAPNSAERDLLDEFLQLSALDEEEEAEAAAPSATVQPIGVGGGRYFAVHRRKEQKIDFLEFFERELQRQRRKEEAERRSAELAQERQRKADERARAEAEDHRRLEQQALDELHGARLRHEAAKRAEQEAIRAQHDENARREREAQAEFKRRKSMPGIFNLTPVKARSSGLFRLPKR